MLRLLVYPSIIILFFIIILIVVLVNTSSLENSLDMNDKSVKANYAFGRIYSITDILASEYYIKHNSIIYPVVKESTLITEL